MSIFDYIKGMGKKESAAARATISMFTPGQPVYKTGVTPDDAYSEGYASNPYVYSAISYIARSCAGIPWQLKQRRGTDTESSFDEHPLLTLLKRPNPYQGRTRFVEQFVSQLLVAGDAYIERNGPNDLRRPPLELYALNPGRTKIVAGDSKGIIGGYEYTAGGITVKYKPEQILHLCLTDPWQDYYGMSPLKPGGKSTDENNAQRAWNTALMQNGARPSGGLVSEGNLTDAQYKRLQDQTKDQYTGAKNAGKFMLLEGGLKWLEMSLSQKDMDWLEGMKLSAREIAIVFSVPPELIGDSSNKTYSNYQEARKAFYQETVLPLLDYIRDELNNWLVPLYGENLYLDYNSDEIEALQEDRDKLYTRAGQAYQYSLLTRNEARAMIGVAEDTTDPTSNEFRKLGATITQGQGSTDPSADPNADPDTPKALCSCGHEHKQAPLNHAEQKFANDIQDWFGDMLVEVEANVLTGV